MVTVSGCSFHPAEIDSAHHDNLCRIIGGKYLMDGRMDGWVRLLRTLLTFSTIQTILALNRESYMSSFWFLLCNITDQRLGLQWNSFTTETKCFDSCKNFHRFIYLYSVCFSAFPPAFWIHAAVCGRARGGSGDWAGKYSPVVLQNCNEG